MEEYRKNSQEFPQLMDMMAKHKTMDIDSVGCSVSKQSNDFSMDSNYSWIEGSQAKPWWRSTDTNELACFVSRKYLNHIENCDLPPPQEYFRGQPYATISDDKIKTCFDWETKFNAFSNLTIQAKGSLESGLMMHKMSGPLSNEGHLYFDSTKSSRSLEQVFEGGLSKAQLMEALCHSQTRAREAEEVAKRAYAEKEDIIAVLIIQASQLFAYKQWFQLLQLETLNNHIKDQDQSIFNLFPMTLPWVPFEFEGMKHSKRKPKFANAKYEMVCKPKSNVTTYGVAFALGLSLVGAGLLLGWNVGWMLPRF